MQFRTPLNQLKSLLVLFLSFSSGRKKRNQETKFPTKKTKETMVKLNYVEVMGNLTDDPAKHEKVTFVKVALWKANHQNPKKEFPTVFTNVSFIG